MFFLKKKLREWALAPVYLFLVFLIHISSTQTATASQIKAEFLGKYKIWSVFKYKLANDTVCFAASKPYRLSSPPTQNMMLRAYIAHWQKKAKNEVSFFLRGVNAKGNIQVRINQKQFNMKRIEERAFMDSKNKESKMLAQMKAGNKMKVRVGKKGQASFLEQTYSLMGLSKALKELAKACPSAKELAKPAPAIKRLPSKPVKKPRRKKTDIFSPFTPASNTNAFILTKPKSVAFQANNLNFFDHE